MPIWCTNPPEFQPGDRVVSLITHHPPEIEPGTKGTIVSSQIGSLYAVHLPDGELHRWFAGFELQAVHPQCSFCGILCEGSFAIIVSTKGHPSHIKSGTIVRIIKAIAQVPYYELVVDKKDYHRWLAEFEITSLEVVSQIGRS